MPVAILPPTSINCCAIIITYNADSHFFERLQRIAEQFNFVVIVDNASEQCFKAHLQHFCQKQGSTSLKLIQNSHNGGIAKALNQGLAYAIAQDFPWVITFDQDTLIYPELLSELSAIYNEAPVKPVIMGCNYFHEALNRPAINAPKPFRVIERKTLITSGTLLWSTLPETLGWFREDYFIDSVDHEFSLRLRKQGYRLWMSTQVLMRHSIGRTTTFHRPTLFKIPEHSALRKYYITRNCLVTVFNYYRQEPLWCLRQFARLSLEFLSIILYEQTRMQKIAAVGLGVGHALKGTMGELAQYAWIKKEHDANP